MGELRFLTAGESHGPELVAIIEGIPAGLEISEERLNEELSIRQKGYGRGDRQKIEQDRINVVSGIRFGETLGSPITLKVVNSDFVNWQDRMSAFGSPTHDLFTAVRPGHADLTGALKYNRKDIRDILERSSARETTMRVAVGTISKMLLKKIGICINAHVCNIGGIAIDNTKIDYTKLSNSRKSLLNCLDLEAEQLMIKRINEAKKAGDTLGGIFEVIAKGVPIGLGSHIQWDKRLDGKLAGALMSIQAIKGIEIGAGFECARQFGSEIHDEIFIDEKGCAYRKTNRAGGLEGGMTNGEPIVIRAAMKPIPTLMKPLNTVDFNTLNAVKASKERSDVCAVPTASLVGESMVAFILAQAICEKFASDNVVDLLTSVREYTARLGEVWTKK